MSAPTEVPTTEDRVFDSIVDYKAAHDGNSPSNRNIMDACAISSTSVVNYHLRRLAAAGRIRLDFSLARSIEVPGARWLPPAMKP